MMRKPYDVSKHPPSALPAALPSNGRLYAGDSMYIIVDEIRLHYVDYAAHFIYLPYMNMCIL